MRCSRRAAILAMVPVAGVALDPKERKGAKVATGDEWLRSHESDGPLVFIEEMDYGFHELLNGEIHRRKKISLRMTTLADKADFRLTGKIQNKEDRIRETGRKKGHNGARHFAALSLVSTETGEVVWACHEDDRDKFDFNSTGKSLRRVAERCVNHLVKEIRGH